MIVRIYEILEILGIWLCLNLLFVKRIHFDILDALFVVVEMILMEAVNYWMIGTTPLIFVYAVIIAYAALKFKPTFYVGLVNTVLCLLTVSLAQLLFSVPAILLQGYIAEGWIICIVNAVVLGVVAVLGGKERLYKLSHMILHNEWLMRIIVILSFICVIYMIITFKFSSYLYLDDYIVMGISFVLIMIITAQWQRTRSENLIRKQEQEMQETYNEVYAKLVERIRKRQHDFDNHINAIYSQHMVSQSLEELIERQTAYCQTLEKDNRYNKLLSCGSSVLIGFLYVKFQEAEKRNCKIQYHVKTQDLSCKIPVYKMIEIVGILLDNAVEAVEEEKEIYVEIVENDEIIHIEIRNPFRYVTQNELRLFMKEGYSTKGDGRGLGLANVIETLLSYGSELFLYNKEENGENWFVARIDISK